MADIQAVEKNLNFALLFLFNLHNISISIASHSVNRALKKDEVETISRLYKNTNDALSCSR